MSNLKLDVQVAVRSPFIFQGLDPASYGYDANAIRDELHRPIIPGDHLRGHLRHALETLAQAAPSGRVDRALIALLMGDESPKRNAQAEGAQDLPANRGMLIVKDLEARDAGIGPETKPVSVAAGEPFTRVRIDEDSGTAMEGMLQTVELVAGIGSVVRFRGEIVVRAHPALPDRVDVLLDRALRLVPAMGAVKSAGFGEIVHQDSWIRRSRAVNASPRPRPTADRLSVEVEFDQPILVNAERTAANAFSGATIVPGAALKGALAEALRPAHPDIDKDGNAFGTSFSRIAISHAFPVLNGRLADRAIPNALAAITVEDGEPRHLIGDMSRPGTFERLVREGVPAFPLDWKAVLETEVRGRLARPESGLRHLPRGRVKIDASGVADEGNLFVVAPVGVADRRWRFTIDRNGADAGTFSQVLAALDAGLDGLGRTGATMRVAADGLKSETRPAPRATGIDGVDHYVVTLETPAVLTDPDDPRPPRIQYEATFRELSGAAGVELVDCFALRRFYGNYMGFRFRSFGPGRYQPFEVTEPGAVFVIRPDAQGAFASWLDHVASVGLPAIRRAGPVPTATVDWRRCPFVPENGYGAISVGLDLSAAVSV